MSTANVEIAKEILKQIKALDFWFLARIGYNSPIAVENGVIFKVRGAKVGYAFVEIKLNGLDLYDVRVYKVRRVQWETKITELGNSKDVYFDSLISVLSNLVDGKV